MSRDTPASQRDLDALEQQLRDLRAIVREREFELGAARSKLDRAEQLLDGWRQTVRTQEKELVDGEAKLLEAELEAERLLGELTSIRSGRAYRLMRFVWRLRRPLKRRATSR